MPELVRWACPVCKKGLCSTLKPTSKLELLCRECFWRGLLQTGPSPARFSRGVSIGPTIQCVKTTGEEKK